MARIAANAYSALRTGAGIVDRSDVAHLIVRGADRRAWLQGMLTNDVAALVPGRGCYAAMLTAQGRMITDMRVLELGDALLLDLPASTAAGVRTHLDRLIFSEDVRIEDETAAWAELGVYGPDAAAVVASALSIPASDLAAFDVYQNMRVAFGGVPLVVIGSDEAGVRGFDLVFDRGRAATIAQALTAAGGVEVDAATAEGVRIEAGRPRFGVDMDTDTIPLEAGIDERAISRTKGCYVGQEVIIRVLDRGHGRVAKRLVGLAFDAGSEPPSPGDVVQSADRAVGRITSAALSPALEKPIALGYVQRDFTSPGTPVEVGSSHLRAMVSGLPFV